MTGATYCFNRENLGRKAQRRITGESFFDANLYCFESIHPMMKKIFFIIGCIESLIFSEILLILRIINRANLHYGLSPFMDSNSDTLTPLFFKKRVVRPNKKHLL